MKLRIAVLAILAALAISARTTAHARGSDDVGAKGKKRNAAHALVETKVRAPQYVIVTKAGRITIHDAAEAPADENSVESGDREGEVSYVGKDGLVHRVYTVEHLQKLRATFGDHTADLIDEAHRVGGRTLVKDALDLKAALESLGTQPATARDAVFDYLGKPTGKKRDDALEDALIANGIIPSGMKGTGRSVRQFLDIAANSALLGGVGADDITPGLVKGFDDVKHGRRTIDDLLNEYGNGGAGVGASDDDAKSDDAGPGNSGGYDSDAGGGADDALGGGYQDESHDDTERGDDDATPPAPGGNPAGDDPAGADDGDDTGSSGGATYTVDEVNHNDDGTTDVTFHVTGSDGQDGIYTTTYNSDGTYTTTNAVTGEVVGSGTGTPPDVEPGDTTQTTDGDQAVFPSDDGEGGDDGAGSEGDGGSDSGTSGSDGSGDGAQQGGAEGSVGYTPNPDGEGAPLPDDIQEFVDRTLRADEAKLKGPGGGGDDDVCDGDGKRVVRIPKDRPSPVEVAELEKARKLKLIGNPKGVDAPRTGTPSGPPAQDGGDIDWGPDHVGNEGMGGGGVDPRGTKKIGADHRNDSAGVGGGFGGGSVGAPSNGNGAQSNGESGANAGGSKKQAKRKVGSVTNKKLERARIGSGPKAKTGAGAADESQAPPVKPKSLRRSQVDSPPTTKSPLRGIRPGKKPRAGGSKD